MKNKPKKNLHPNIRKYLSNIGKRGSARRTELHRDKLQEWGRQGGLKRAENWRRNNPWFSTGNRKED